MAYTYDVMPRPPLSRLAVAALVSLAPAMPLVITATGGGQASGSGQGDSRRPGAATPWSGARDPAWSADGASIAFSHIDQIWISTRDGQNARPLVVWDSGAGAAGRRAPAPAEPAGRTCGTADPGWTQTLHSPRERSSRKGQRPLPKRQPSRTGRRFVRPCACARVIERDPAWSPDGRRIAFAADRGEGFDIYLVAVTGGAPERLTFLPGDERWPAWTPDGRLIFAHRAADQWDLMRALPTAPPAGGTVASSPEAITDTPFDETEPSVSPDGAYVLFASNRESDGGDVDLWIASLAEASTSPSSRLVASSSASDAATPVSASADAATPAASCTAGTTIAGAPPRPVANARVVACAARSRRRCGRQTASASRSPRSVRASDRSGSPRSFSRRRALAVGAGAVFGATAPAWASAGQANARPSAGAPRAAGEETRSLDELYRDALAQGGKLVIYAGGDLANSGSGASARTAFRNRFPDIDLTLIVDYSKYHDVRVDNQLATGTLVPDVVQLQTLQDFTRWKRENRLLRYKPAGFSKLHKKFRDPDGAWVAGMVIAFSYIYDVAAAGANPPLTPLDLVDPRWKGAIASSYPHDDDAVLYLFALYAETYGWDWVARFAAEQPQFARGSFSPGAAVTAKQKIIGVGAGGNPLSTGPTRMVIAEGHPFMAWGQRIAILGRPPTRRRPSST